NPPRSASHRAAARDAGRDLQKLLPRQPRRAQIAPRGGERGGAGVPNFRHRLTRAQQRIYDRSDAIASIPLHATPRLHQAVHALPALLLSGDNRRVEHAAQAIADEIAGSLRVPRVRIIVSGTRPSNARGELHGLYTPAAHGTATIKLWMLTAK